MPDDLGLLLVDARPVTCGAQTWKYPVHQALLERTAGGLGLDLLPRGNILLLTLCWAFEASHANARYFRNCQCLLAASSGRVESGDGYPHVASYAFLVESRAVCRVTTRFVRQGWRLPHTPPSMR